MTQSSRTDTGRVMSSPGYTDSIDDAILDAVELDDYVAPRRPPHRDQYVQYTHEMPELSAETASRLLIRVVPLIYGGLLGHLVGSVPFGLTVGVVLSAAFDLHMGRHSMLRTLYRMIVSRR